MTDTARGANDARAWISGEPILESKIEQRRLPLTKFGRRLLWLGLVVILLETLILMVLQPMQVISRDLVAFYMHANSFWGSALIVGVGVTVSIAILIVISYRFKADGDEHTDARGRWITLWGNLSRAMAGLGIIAFVLGLTGIVKSFGYLSVEDVALPEPVLGWPNWGLVVLWGGPVLLALAASSGLALLLVKSMSSPKLKNSTK